MSSVIVKEHFRRQVQAVRDLPTLPQTVDRIAAAIERPETSAEDLARIIEMDQVITTRVLALVNSAYYGFPGRITTVSRAVVVIGLDAVKALTLGASVFKMMQQAGMLGLWRHSVGVAMTSRTIARISGREAVADEVFTAGLIHDLGKVIMAVCVPEAVAQVEQAMHTHGMGRIQAEQLELAFTHADVAGWLTEAWKLPGVLTDPILHHHHPDQAVTAPVQTAIVHLADVLVKTMGCGETGDDLVPMISPSAYTQVGLSDEQLSDVVEAVTEDFITIEDYV